MFVGIKFFLYCESVFYWWLFFVWFCLVPVCCACPCVVSVVCVAVFYGDSDGFFEWDWGEFGIEKLDNEFAIIYGIVKGEDKMKGGIHFVNDSMHVFIPYGKANIEYLEWGRINGFKKPTKLHIYGESVYGENRNIAPYRSRCKQV